MPAGEYGAILGDPDSLFDFISAFKANRSQFDDIVVDMGLRPVRDESQLLECEISLAQVMQMLVFTCAKRLLTEGAEAPAPRRAPPPPPEKTGLFGKKKEAPPPPPRTKGENERKLDLLRNYLAFDWQLPLLDIYAHELSLMHINDLGRDLLLLKLPEKLRAVTSLTVPEIRESKRHLGPDLFTEALVDKPQALAWVAQRGASQISLWWDLLKSRTWDLYLREDSYFDYIYNLDRERFKAMATHIPVASLDGVLALERLELDRLPLFLQGLETGWGTETVERLLKDSEFCRTTLLPIVQAFQRVDATPERYLEVVILKCTAIQNQIDAYLDRDSVLFR